MSKEQIEEMKKVLESTCDETECNHPHNCDLCQATRLYEAGYRKQSEGEWIAHIDDFDICSTEFVCSVCKESFTSSELTDEEFLKMMKFCPNCGARMKGE